MMKIHKSSTISLQKRRGFHHQGFINYKRVGPEIDPGGTSMCSNKLELTVKKSVSILFGSKPEIKQR